MKRGGALGDIAVGFVVFASVWLILFLVFRPLGFAIAIAESSNPVINSMASWLFFWPQLVTVQHGVTMTASTWPKPYIQAEHLRIWVLLFWCAVTVAFASMTRNYRIVNRGLLALPVVLSVAYAAMRIMALSGVAIVLDSPQLPDKRDLASYWITAKYRPPT